MPLMPKRTKFRKSHRGSRAGNAQRGTTVAFGDFGLQALDRGWMTNRGNMLFEVAGVPESQAKEAMRLASYKLGLPTRFVVRNPHA